MAGCDVTEDSQQRLDALLEWLLHHSDNPPKRYDILMNSFTECPDQETSGRIPMLAGESP